MKLKNYIISELNQIFDSTGLYIGNFHEEMIKYVADRHETAYFISDIDLISTLPFNVKHIVTDSDFLPNIIEHDIDDNNIDYTLYCDPSKVEDYKQYDSYLKENNKNLVIIPLSFNRSGL